MLLSPNLSLDYIDVNAAQREVTHNAAIRALDALVQLAVLDRDLATPPSSPSDGQRWIVAASPTGAWTGKATQIAGWQDGAWRFYVPRIGWLVYVIDEGKLVAWSGSAWVDALSMLTSLQNLALLGVGTTADATNPFSAKLNNALWAAKTVAEGGDGNLRYKLSKESASKTLSFLLQTNFSGRAEIGLTGDDDLHIKVSSDGSTWIDAIKVAGASGAVAITSAAAAAFAVGRQGSTSPALKIDGSAASCVTGLGVTAAAAGSGVALAAISSGTDESITFDAKGAGTIKLGSVSTGAILFGQNGNPASNGGAALGTTSLKWSNLFLASGAVINFNSGDVTITHSADALAFAGAATKYTFDSSLNIGASGTPVTRCDIQMAANGGNPATSGTAQANGVLRLRGGFNGILDIGCNGGTCQWLQSTDATDLSQTYPLHLNPNGGAVRVGANLSGVTDNSVSCGTSALRWSVVYAATGTINTSDARLKDNFAGIPDVLARAMQIEVGAFDQYDGSFVDGVPRRTGGFHRSLGVRAQQLRSLFPEFTKLVHGDEGAELLGIVESKIGVIALASLQNYVSKTDARLAAIESRIH
jgi:Protein of unknown function (DUF2793)